VAGVVTVEAEEEDEAATRISAVTIIAGMISVALTIAATWISTEEEAVVAAIRATAREVVMDLESPVNSVARKDTVRCNAGSVFRRTITVPIVQLVLLLARMVLTRRGIQIPVQLTISHQS
jgi:hypothetical protein